jgi:hypothetical protein
MKAHFIKIARLGFMLAGSIALQGSLVWGQTNNELIQRMTDEAMAAAATRPAVALPSEQQMRNQTVIMANAVYYQVSINGLKAYLQNDLKVGLQYTYVFNIYVGAQDSQRKFMDVPDGWYALDMAVVLPEIDPLKLRNLIGKEAVSPYDRFVTHASKIVNVSGGRIVEEISLRFPSLGSTTVTSHLYIQLMPLESQCKDRTGKTTDCIRFQDNGLVDETRSQKVVKADYFSNLISVPFVPTFTGGGGNAPFKGKVGSPNPGADATLRDYIFHAIQHRSAMKKNVVAKLSSEAYARDNRLNLISINDHILKRVDQRGLEGKSAQTVIRKLLNMNSGAPGSVNLPSNNPKLFQYICTLLAATNKQVTGAKADMQAVLVKPYLDPANLLAHTEACQVNAPDIFRLSVQEHVQGFDSRSVRLVEDFTANFSTSSSFGLNRSDSDSFSRSINYSPLEPVFRVLDMIGIPLKMVGINLSFSRSHSESRSTSEGSGNWIGIPLDFRVLKVEIPVTQSQRCLEIAVNPRKGSPFYNVDADSLNGLYICDDVTKQSHKLMEIYANVYSTTGMDSYSPATQPFNMSLQGEHDLSTFFYLNRSSLDPDHNNDIWPTSFLEKARQYFALTPHSNPGIVTTPLTFPKETVPSWKSLLTGSYRERFVGEKK